jgi:hypothetical protein
MKYALGNMLGGANGTGRPSINKMAFMGDSITEYVGTTLNDYEFNGYASWDRTSYVIAIYGLKQYVRITP